MGERTGTDDGNPAGSTASTSSLQGRRIEMVYPTSDRTIDTPYGQKGSMWGCGWHDGVDFAVGTGTPVMSMWGGTVWEAAYPTSFGSAFGRAVVIDHDKLPDGSPGGWGIYCHLSEESVSVGQRVEAGTVIGKTGSTGNVSGPHLHVGVYMTPYWTSGGGKDPQRWLDAGGGTAPPPATGGVHVTAHVYSNKCGYGEPSNGDASSDTIKELQHILNGISLVGGQTLNISGVWDADTDEEVRLWQEQVCHDVPDPAGRAYLGPNQFAAMFPSPPYTRHDAGLPAGAAGNPSGPAPEPEPPAQGLPPAPALMCPGAVWDPVSNFPGLRPFTGGDC